MLGGTLVSKEGIGDEAKILGLLLLGLSLD